jgi:hypothetical protein
MKRRSNEEINEGSQSKEPRRSCRIAEEEVRAFLIFLHGAQNGNSHFRPHVLSAKNVSCIHTWEAYMGVFSTCSPMCVAFYAFGRPFPFALVFLLGSTLGAVSL